MRTIKKLLLIAMRSFIYKTRFIGRKIYIDPTSSVSIHSRIKVRGTGSIIIGKNCTIEEFCKIETTDGSIIVHDNCHINSYAHVTGNGTIELGDDFIMHSFAIVQCFENPLIIGKSCSLNPFSILYDGGGLKIGNYVRIAAHTVIIPANHKYQDKNQLIHEQGISHIGVTVGDDVWIASNCTVLDGVNIGKGCVVGAGSVVTRSIPEYTVVAGSPAKKLFMRGEKNNA
jgi:acetyltransferase-like isoleucine patch superfamily enzyme